MPYAMPVASFAEIEAEFLERVRHVVRCTAATVDTRDRPRSRVWHPIWEGPTGYIATTRQPLKARHLDRNPYVSLTYFDYTDAWHQVYVDCRVAWEETLAGKRHAWQLFAETPPPLGYDPASIWGHVENAAFGVLRLQPWRLELVDGPGQTRVWRAP